MRTGFTSTVSSQFQLTIPKAVCDALHLQRGQPVKTLREFGVFRSLAHTVLTRPLRPRSPVVRRRRTGGMPSLVVRLPGEAGTIW